MMKWNLIGAVRRQRPLIHCITNYVTACNVANMILAAGASPVMADNAGEAAEVEEISQGLMLNLGTLREGAAESMLLAGHVAARLGHPVILDPVGVGSSRLRRETAARILEEIPCTAIRGNASEIRALAGEMAYARGVDVDGRDAMKGNNREDTAAMLQRFSGKTGAVVIMTGEKDLIVDGQQVCLVNNGHPAMARITGSGCMLDGILTSFEAVQMDQKPRIGAECRPGASRFWKAVYAVLAAGICGELAGEKAERYGCGTGSFQMYFLDAMSLLTDEEIERRADIEF